MSETPAERGRRRSWERSACEYMARLEERHQASDRVAASRPLVRAGGRRSAIPTVAQPPSATRAARSAGAGALSLSGQRPSRRRSAPREGSSLSTKSRRRPPVNLGARPGLAAVAGEENWNRARARRAEIFAWARTLDRPAEVKRIEKPARSRRAPARPTAALRPPTSRTGCATRSIYAKPILKLRALDPIDLPPGAADRGQSYPRALSDFTRTFAAGCPAASGRRTIRHRRHDFETLEDYHEARGFWWPRFRRIADGAGWERTLRAASVAALRRRFNGKIDHHRSASECSRSRPRRPHRAPRGGGRATPLLDYKERTVA